MSLDVSSVRPVEIAFAGKPAQNKVSLWRMSSDSITANNEFEAGRPQVAVAHETLNDFGPGYTIGRIFFAGDYRLSNCWRTF